MRARTRKFIGVFVLLALIIGYALVAMVAGMILLKDTPEWTHFFYFITAGLIWALPAMLLVRWMQRPD